MQQKIKQLSPQEIAKIAAGEVVERPANVIKELLENSIDAGATHITLELDKAGKKRISISDNGCGMSPEDMRICFIQHTTSKITRVEDLQSIGSYGFRGEALASISAVSKATIISREHTSEQGLRLDLDQGRISQEEICSASPGTSITIYDLLYNVPARQKFLKKDETELRNASLIFQAFAMTYPHIHFQMKHNDNMLYNCPQTESHLQRIQQIWPSHIARHALCLPETQHGTINVQGVITDMQTSRYDRSWIYTFVNNRLVKNKELAQAVMRGYQGILPQKKFPATALFITLPSQEIDVNIHPKKEEILFLHPGKVQTAVQKAITQTLHTQESSHSSPSSAHAQSMQTPGWMQTVQPDNATTAQATILRAPQTTNTPPTHTQQASIITKHVQQSTPNTTVKASKEHNAPQQIQHEPAHEQTQGTTHTSTPKTQILGQWQDTYIVASKDSKLILIDQHAAHERIIFEQLKKRINNIASVQLMFPEFITLDIHDMEILKPHLTTLAMHGIKLEEFSETELLIQATPAALQSKVISELVQELLKIIGSHEDIQTTKLQNVIHEQLHTSISCKTAIKAGQKLTMETMRNLVETLQKTENYTTCPHGRPTHYAFDEADITKKFKRDYKDKKIDPDFVIL